MKFNIQPLDPAALKAATERQNQLTKPQGSLGRLEEIGIQLAGISGRCPPPVPRRKAILVFAGDHGVVKQGVSAFPQEVTPQMVLNFLNGGAAVNVLAKHAGARLRVVDAGVAFPLPAAPGLVAGRIANGTADISEGPAMTRAQAIAAIELGASVVREEIAAGLDLLACGEMGIGNTTPATAIISVLTGRPPPEVAGPGTGLAADRVLHKARVVERSISVNRPDRHDALDVLAKVGGFEIGAIAGAMLAAAEARLPIVVDGFIVTAGAMLAATMEPNAAAYMIAGHRSAEPGHDIALQALNLKALLDMRLRLGEGTGSVLAMHQVEAAALVLRDMATFASAGVSNKE